jgi:hypothetical protein
MSEDLDTQIAELVMGEPEPDPWLSDVPGTYGNSPENWVCTHRPMSEHMPLTWEPLPFSSDLDLAMRASETWMNKVHLDKQEEGLVMFYRRFDTPPFMVSVKDAYGTVARCQGTGETLPEAICRLLLALVKEEK